MAHLLFVKDKTARNGQEVGDFVLAYDFEPTATEKELFDWVPAPNVNAEEVVASLEAKKDEKKEYPKFPFTKTNLTTKDVEDIESKTVDKAQTIALIDKMKLKTPVKAIEPITVEK